MIAPPVDATPTASQIAVRENADIGSTRRHHAQSDGLNRCGKALRLLCEPADSLCRPRLRLLNLPQMITSRANFAADNLRHAYERFRRKARSCWKNSMR